MRLFWRRNDLHPHEEFKNRNKKKEYGCNNMCRFFCMDSGEKSESVFRSLFTMSRDHVGGLLFLHWVRFNSMQKPL